MLTYNKSVFSLQILMRIHGSAAYKATLPALLSVCLYFVFRSFIQEEEEHDASSISNNKLTSHPYAIGALVSSISFVLIFRANFGYQRYWEGATSIYQSMSKWLDAVTMTGAFHYQSSHYASIKPPAMYDHPGLNYRTGLRRRRLVRENEFYSNDHPVYQEKKKDEHFDANQLQQQQQKQQQQQQQNEQLHDIETNHTHIHANAIPQQQPHQAAMSISSASLSDRSHNIQSHSSGKVSSTNRRQLKNSANISMSMRSINQVVSNNKNAKSRSGYTFDNRKTSNCQELESDWNKLIQCNVYANCNSNMNVKPQSILEDILDENYNGEYDSSKQSIKHKDKPHIQPKLTTFEEEETSPRPFRDENGRPSFHLHGSEGLHGLGQVDGGISGTPSLFLQELCHLTSLLNAVALSTLRIESETNSSPLAEYEPGSDWPPVDDPMLLDGSSWDYVGRVLSYWFWLDQTPSKRQEYIERRPLEVLGGVSDEELVLLQNARGASAKVNLCWFWLVEFITREHLAGSTGDVGPPIISRIYQFLSDGCVGYNSARKISFIPFPFPHAQISLLAMVFLLVSVPLLCLEYTNPNETYIGALINFAVVELLFGLHEVARELENPFRNVPNELPLCTLQAQFNEGLLQMQTGYHPNLFFNTEQYKFRSYDSNGDNVVLNVKTSTKND